MKKKTPERHQAILRAAFDEVTRHGYFETRMEDVARRARVAKGTVYLYFKDKTDLYLGLVDWLLGQALEFVREVDARPISPRAKLARVFEVWSENVFGRPGVQSLLALEQTNLPSGALKRYLRILVPRVTQMVEAVARIIRAGIASGRFRPVDADVAALAFLQAFRASMVLSRGDFLAGRDPLATLDIFFSGVLSRRTTKRS